MVYIIINYPGLIKKIPENDKTQYYDVIITINALWLDTINEIKKLEIPEVPLYKYKKYERWLNDDIEYRNYIEQMSKFKEDLIQLFKDERFMRGVKSVIIYDNVKDEVYMFKAKEVIHANAIWSQETVNKLIETIDKLIKP